MDFIGIKNKNQYQWKQLIQFFEKLQTMKPFIKVITNQNFQSSILFPVIKARKEFGEYGVLIVQVAILQELYFFKYRFFFITLFPHLSIRFEIVS